MLLYINGSNKIIKRYKGTQLVYQAEDSSDSGDTSGIIMTGNTLSFKYIIKDIVTTSNVSINGTTYKLTAADGESLGDNYYKYTTTPTDAITSIEFISGNVFEIYALPDSLTSMNYMFGSASSLINLDLRGLNVSNVSMARYCFSGCYGLTSLNVSGWDTSNFVDCLSIFRNCSALQELDLSTWNTSNITKADSLFNGCRNLRTLNVSGWDISKITAYATMFNNCSLLSTLILGNVSQSTFDWWSARLSEAGISPTIEYTIV